MFGGTPNPYDEIVASTTSENLTAENWDLILTLCDKISESHPPSQGASQAVQALAKRLSHRNPNVQLYALTVAEAIGKNCGADALRELNSRVWVNALERVVEERGGANEKVKRKTLMLIGYWTESLGLAEDQGGVGDEGLMGELRDKLKAKHYSLTPPPSPPPPTVDDEIRRREEEELQRVLELSLSDKGGRSWAAHDSNPSSGAGSSSMAAAYSTGYTPATVSQPETFTSTSGQVYSAATTQQATSIQESRPSSSETPVKPMDSPLTPVVDLSNQIVTRVRALHSFESTEPGELGFDKGDIIKVVDRNYKDWWRGQLRGKTGIFPVNYVEILPEPSSEEMAKEVEEEMAVFRAGIEVEKLLTMLRSYDPKDRGVGSFGDDEEIHNMYRNAILLRPKIVKLIDKYSQKRADLVSMNETFVRARTIFERMMEESLARPDLSSTTSYYSPQQIAGSYGGLGYPQPYQDQRSSLHPMYGQGPFGGPTPSQAQSPALYQQSTHPPQPQPVALSQVQPRQGKPYITEGPPYPFVPEATYADPNVQAWATYYTRGGKDKAGAVYFIEVPGVSEATVTPQFEQSNDHRGSSADASVGHYAQPLAMMQQQSPQQQGGQSQSPPPQGHFPSQVSHVVAPVNAPSLPALTRNEVAAPNLLQPSTVPVNGTSATQDGSSRMEVPPSELSTAPPPAEFSDERGSIEAQATSPRSLYPLNERQQSGELLNPYDLAPPGSTQLKSPYEAEGNSMLPSHTPPHPNVSAVDSPVLSDLAVGELPYPGDSTSVESDIRLRQGYGSFELPAFAPVPTAIGPSIQKADPGGVVRGGQQDLDEEKDDGTHRFPSQENHDASTPLSPTSTPSGVNTAIETTLGARGGVSSSSLHNTSGAGTVLPSDARQQEQATLGNTPTWVLPKRGPQPRVTSPGRVPSRG